MPCDAPVTTATFRSTLMTDSFVPHNFHAVGFGITGDRDATRLMANQLDEGVADTLVPAVSASLLQRRQLAAQRANLLESRGREVREFPACSGDLHPSENLHLATMTVLPCHSIVALVPPGSPVPNRPIQASGLTW